MADQPICIEVPQVLSFCFQPEHFDGVCTPLGSCTPPRGSTVKCTILSGTIATLGGALSFGPAVNYPVGALPFAITAADFNADGIIDLAVANLFRNNVSILLGKGDGTFTEPAPIYPVGAHPFAITAADLNGDGIIDLAVANFFGKNVSILLGKGDGTFTEPAPTYPVGSASEGITAADFNGDGVIDLAVTNSRDNNISILLGKGDGTFAEPAPAYAVGAGPYGITAADFNGDGVIDLAVTNQLDNNVSILQGKGDGTFVEPAPTYAVGASPVAITAADFNGDGVTDLAVTNAGDNNVSILLGKGNGTFVEPAPTYAVGASPVAITAADFNCDGLIDLAVTNAGDNNVSILLGKGNGTFMEPAPTYSVEGSPDALTAADFNGDGKIDLAVANASDSNVSILINNSICRIVPTTCTAVSRTSPDQGGLANVTVAATVAYTLQIINPKGLVICTFPNQTLRFITTVNLCAPDGAATVCDLTVICGPCFVTDRMVCCSFDVCLVIKSVFPVVLSLPGIVITPALCVSPSPFPLACPPNVPTVSYNVQYCRAGWHGPRGCTRFRLGTIYRNGPISILAKYRPKSENVKLYYYLFYKSGFTQSVSKASNEVGIRLVDVDDMF